MAHSDQQRDKNEASCFCSDSQLGWALQKARSQTVRFTDVVDQYLTMKFDFGERSNNKAVAADMSTSRKPDRSRMFAKRLANEESSARPLFETGGHS